MPPLQRGDDTWALSAKERATELASVLQSKSQLPAAIDNDYTELSTTPAATVRSMPRLKVSKVYDLLRLLDETSGTGPDLLPARVLKHCAAELATPVTLLARKLRREHCWPL